MRARRQSGGGWKRRGFTLIEVLAALLFLAIAVPAIVGALSVASRASEVAERGSIAGGLAENKLNEMLTDSNWQIASQTSGDWSPNWPGYRWVMTSQTWAGDTTNTMTELDVEVFYPVQGSEHSVKLATLVNPSASPSPSPTSGTGSTGSTTGGATTK